MNYENEYTQVETDKYYKLLENEEYYKKAYSMLRDLLPSKEEIVRSHATFQEKEKGRSLSLKNPFNPLNPCKSVFK